MASLTDHNDEQNVLDYEKIQLQTKLRRIIEDQNSEINNLKNQIKQKNNQLADQLRLKYSQEIQNKDKQIEELNIQVDEEKQIFQKYQQDLMKQLEEEQKKGISIRSQMEQIKNAYTQQIEQQRESYNTEIFRLKDELSILHNEINSIRNQTFDRSLSNYTSEEAYIKEVERLRDYLNGQEQTYLAEIIHYKREAEIAQAEANLAIEMCNEEKKQLHNKFDTLKELSDQLEGECGNKIKQFQQDLIKILKEMSTKSTSILQMQREKDQQALALLDKNIEGEKIWMREKAEILAQQKIEQESHETKIRFYESEIALLSEKNIIEIENYIRENEILKQEKTLLEKSIGEFKKITQEREKGFNIEIQRLQQSHDKLIALSSQRENALQTVIHNLQESVIQVQKAYEQRENLLTQGTAFKTGATSGFNTSGLSINNNTMTRKDGIDYDEIGFGDGNNDDNQIIIQSQNNYQSWEELLSTKIQKFDQLYVLMRNKLLDKKNNDNQKEFKMITQKILDKIAELDHIKTQVFDKKNGDKKLTLANFEQLIEKYMQITDNFSGKLDQLIQNNKEYLPFSLSQSQQFQNSVMQEKDDGVGGGGSGGGGRIEDEIGIIQQPNGNEGTQMSKTALLQTMKSARLEIEATKYDELLTKKESELNLAKRNLYLYAESIKKLEEQLQENIDQKQKENDQKRKQQQSSEEEQIINQLNLEKSQLEKTVIALQRENNLLQNEKKVIQETKEKYEDYFGKELQRIEDTQQKRFDEMKNIITSLNQIESNNKSLMQDTDHKSVSRSPMKSRITVNKQHLKQNQSIQSQKSKKSINLSINSSQMLSDRNSSNPGRILNQILGEVQVIKNMMKETQKIYLESERINNLIQEIENLEVHNNNLRGIINNEILFVKDQLANFIQFSSMPSKKYDEAFEQFKIACEDLINVKKQMEQNEKQRSKFFTNLDNFYNSEGGLMQGNPQGVIIPSGINPILKQLDSENQAILKNEITNLQNLLNLERQNHKAELNAILENLNQSQIINEKKLASYKQETESISKQNQQMRNNQDQLNQQVQKELKHLKNELSTINKILNEVQMKRVDDRKKFINEMKEFDDKINKKEEEIRKILEKKLITMENIIEKKQKIQNEKIAVQRHEQQVDKSLEYQREKQSNNQINQMRRELKIMQEHLKERESITEQEKQKLNQIIQGMQQSLKNLHCEKAGLIEEVNYLQQLGQVWSRQQMISSKNVNSQGFETLPLDQQFENMHQPEVKFTSGDSNQSRHPGNLLKNK